MKSINKLLIILALSITISACNTTKRPIVEDFTVNMNSPQVAIGEVEMQFDTLMGLGNLKKQTVSVLYFPKEDVVCLKYIYEYYTYHQFWNRRGRLYFINALQKYNEDYTARDLQKDNKKSRRKYGIVRGYLVWQMFSFSVQAYANMNVELGYFFKDKSPYFTVFQRTAEYLDDKSRDSNRSSSNITMYFTRAQAAELSALFEQYIMPGEMPGEYQEPYIPAKETDPNKDAY
ncbi:hypothetical protein, partial [Treponema sp. R80B11-R83G3]